MKHRVKVGGRNEKCGRLEECNVRRKGRRKKFYRLKD